MKNKTNKKETNEFKKSVTGVVIAGIAVVLLLLLFGHHSVPLGESSLTPDRYFHSYVSVESFIPDIAENLRVIDKHWALFDIQDNNFICYISDTGQPHIMVLKSNISLKCPQNIEE